MKKMLCLILVLVLLFGVMPAAAMDGGPGALSEEPETTPTAEPTEEPETTRR